MRRWIALAGRLYPRGWRERYGEEFDALLEEATADWRQFLNVTGGALTMRIANGIPYLKVAGALGLAGALAALSASYRVAQALTATAVGTLRNAALEDYRKADAIKPGDPGVCMQIGLVCGSRSTTPRPSPISAR
jgi:hypothetical protein